jgi:hypothetical protein
MHQLIDNDDWSACSDEFELAIAVLTDDFDSACRVMSKMGVDGPVDKAGYREWPLFREFRKSQQFLATYESVFGESFLAAAIQAAGNDAAQWLEEDRST